MPEVYDTRYRRTFKTYFGVEVPSRLFHEQEIAIVQPVVDSVLSELDAQYIHAIGARLSIYQSYLLNPLNNPESVATRLEQLRAADAQILERFKLLWKGRNISDRFGFNGLKKR